MPDPLLAFHGDPAIKAKYLARVREHQQADAIVQGYGYWQEGKGCAVGCTLQSPHHTPYEGQLGTPEPTAYLQGDMVEAMPKDSARSWPARFLEAIPIGADLSLVPKQ